MPLMPDLSDFSEDELQDVIDDATHRRDELRESREREARIGPYGSKGQDVRDPAHGVIPVPTPNEVEAVGPAHGAGNAEAPARAIDQSTTHLGQTRSEKDVLNHAAQAADQGPTFGTPGDPPEPDPESIEEIETAYDDLDREDRVPRSG